MTDLPVRLEAALREGDVLRVRELVRGLDEADRRACLPVVDKARRRLRSTSWGEGREDAVAVARAATCGGAADAADLLVRAVGRLWSVVGDRAARALVVEVLLERRPPWLADAVVRAAGTEPGVEDGSCLREVEALRVGLGLPRPRNDLYLRWLAGELGRVQVERRREQHTWLESEPVPLAPELAADAELLDLLPDLLRVPDVGAELHLRQARWTDGQERQDAPPELTWPGALRTLVDDGLLDRDDLLDLVLEVLARGGHRNALALFLLVHDALAPTPDEVRSRWRAYVAMLRHGSSTAAARAQALLRAVPDLPLEAVVEAATAVLQRREKGLATTQLTWLERRAADGPDAVLEVLAVGLAHERPDVAEKAVALAVRLVTEPGVAAPAALRHAAAALPPLLQQQAAPLLADAGGSGGVLGGSAGRGGAADGGADGVVADAVTADGAAPDAVDLPGPQPVPVGPVRDLRGLVNAAAEHLETGDPYAAERVLQGLARLCDDRAALRAALAPLVERPLGNEVDDLDLRRDLPVVELVRRAGGAGSHLPTGELWDLVRSGKPLGTGEEIQAAREREPWPAGEGAVGVLAARCAEVAAAVAAGRPRAVLALPDLACGLVDPERLQAGLAASHDLVGRADLEQAVLRVPALDADLLRSLAATRRRAEGRGRELARAWRDGVPQAVVAPAVAVARRQGWPDAAHPDWDGWHSAVAGRPVVDVAVPEGLDVRSLLHRALGGGPPLPLRATRLWWERGSEDPLAVLLTLPAQREVAAAHLAARAVHVEAALDHRDLHCLALLPDAAGPVGRGTALAVGYALGNKHLAARTAGGDALSGLLLPGSLDAGATGHVLGELLALEAVNPGRVASALGEVLRAPGTARPLWQVLVAALPALLAARRRGLHELLAVAAAAAHAASARDEVPGLAGLAAERGSSRLVVEARRLAGVLQG